jgi:triosephosphate isomerase (TIM)
MGRRLLIAGNWKMHHGPRAGDALARQLKAGLSGQTRVDVAVFPTFVTLPCVAARLQHTGVQVGAQDLHAQATGAYTGAVGGEMIRELGCHLVLCGHSERRSVFGDSDADVNAKVHAALRSGLQPVLCIGETLAQRNADQVESVVSTQLEGGLAGLNADQIAATVLAYEPVWAIGTGVTASPAQAQEVHAFIRRWIRERLPAYVADQIRILYGGSVKPGNASTLFSQPDIDGGLVGGASLKAESFIAIVQAD